MRSPPKEYNKMRKTIVNELKKIQEILDILILDYEIDVNTNDMVLLNYLTGLHCHIYHNYEQKKKCRKCKKKWR